MQQINDCGERAAPHTPDMRYRDEEIGHEPVRRGVTFHGGGNAKGEV